MRGTKWRVGLSRLSNYNRIRKWECVQNQIREEEVLSELAEVRGEAKRIGASLSRIDTFLK